MDVDFNIDGNKASIDYANSVDDPRTPEKKWDDNCTAFQAGVVWAINTIAEELSKNKGMKIEIKRSYT